MATASVVDFYQRYYRPERATLVAAGDFDGNGIKDLAFAQSSGEGGVRLYSSTPTQAGSPLTFLKSFTPFGQGQPFSRRQLTAVLREALFSPVHWAEALYVPPIPRRSFLSSAGAWERAGMALSLPFAGVHVIEATKTLYRPIAVRPQRRVAARMSPVLVPASRGVVARSPLP
jgi:hypothetical protein